MYKFSKGILVKTSFVFFLILFSFNVFSEQYICKLTVLPTYDGDTTIYETHLFERDGDYFKNIEDYQERESFKLIRETERYILLNRMTVIIMIEKKKLKIGRYWIGVPQPYRPDFGSCKINQ